MRIVHVIARFNKGGTATWLVNLIEGQRALGDEVWLIAGKVEDSEVEDSRFTTLSGIRIPKLGRSVSPIKDFLSILELRAFLKEFDPDVINTHTAKAGMVGRIAAFSLGVKRPKVVHTYHGHVLYGYFGPITNFIYKRIEIALSRITDLILVSGIRVKNELLEAGIGNERQYVSVKPGIEPVERLKKSDARDKLQLSQDATVVGWLGRISQIKRPDRVIELAREIPQLTFLIGGDGELLQKIRMSAPPNVRFVGWTTPALVWSASDIALLTSDNEAQPISLIEAASLKLPLVGEDVGSVSEVIQSGESGFLANNFKERVEALMILESDPKLRMEMGEQAFVDFNSLFSRDEFIKTHRHAYERVVSQPRD
jgi:glycosyltransferase involved in cell wall biosynthesis